MAGPNGSGKSTILQEVRKNFFSGPFVNADEIEKALEEKHLINLPSLYDLVLEDAVFSNFLLNEGASWLKKAESDGGTPSITSSNGMLVTNKRPSPYDAALAADFIRTQLLKKGETFTFETVLSHSSKISFLKESAKAGYKNYLYFICTVDPAINVERVRQRVALGGHHVAEEKIVKRYSESLRILPQIIPFCHRVYFFDNSTEDRSIDPVAEIDDAQRLLLRAESIPWWVEEFVIQPIYR